MSLSDLANLGEFLSSVTVLGSFVYLTAQMRQTERNQRAMWKLHRPGFGEDFAAFMDGLMEEVPVQAAVTPAERLSRRQALVAEERAG